MFFKESNLMCEWVRKTDVFSGDVDGVFHKEGVIDDTELSQREGEMGFNTFYKFCVDVAVYEDRQLCKEGLIFGEIFLIDIFDVWEDDCFCFCDARREKILSCVPVFKENRCECCVVKDDGWNVKLMSLWVVVMIRCSVEVRCDHFELLKSKGVIGLLHVDDSEVVEICHFLFKYDREYLCVFHPMRSFVILVFFDDLFHTI